MIFRFACLLGLLAIPAALFAFPVVTNVSFVQQSDGAGSTEVIVTYDLASPNGDCDVVLRYSSDGGTSFSTATTTTGAVGAGVSPGTGKTINWAVATDLPGQTVTGNFLVRVVADDGVELLEFVSVPAGTFTMGRTASGDDANFGGSDELPNHQVTLSAYDIGKFEVTNEQFAIVMNWALAEGYLANNTAGAAYAGAGNVYLMAPDSTSTRRLLFDTETGSTYSQIEWTGSAFAPRTRDSQSMANHPMVRVTWFGAATFCNFLAEMEGKPLAYNLSTWELVDADSVTPGLQYVASYRLPTESEWERAAAWDGTKHWIYSFVSDTLTGNARASYNFNNPMNLATEPRTSPVGWFNGVNVSPNGSVPTVDSPSPVGAYDMSGNVWEWCHDWYGSYTASAKTDPTGAAPDSVRVFRGGSWFNGASFGRSARRNGFTPSVRVHNLGFRVLAVR
ncbi:MAG: formylglycine-generating enzyme family protein [Candidatus Sumerlaeia bacterium]|nr:formylglycine-generating enzyme family protein [Candidatus Sumerlaeia bacterium]